MLPPTAQGSTNAHPTSCSNFLPGTPNFLGWDGTNPINCINGIYADPTGNIGIGNVQHPQEALDVNGNVNSSGSYKIQNTPVMSILGTIECVTPEGGSHNGTVWLARNAHGTATGCTGTGQAICSKGSVVNITLYHDVMAAGELGDFCLQDQPQQPNQSAAEVNACHVGLFFCIQ